MLPGVELVSRKVFLLSPGIDRKESFGGEKREEKAYKEHKRVMVVVHRSRMKKEGDREDSEEGLEQSGVPSKTDAEG